MNERQKRKILVVDDDQDVCNMISMALGPKGFEVIIVSDPQKAIEKAKEIEPNLIFVSLVLSRSNGLKVSTAILSIKNLKEVPIFLLISSFEEFNKRYATYLGIRDVLVKPLNTDKIVSETLKTIGEGTVTFERDRLSQVSSVAEKPGVLSSEEKSNGLEKTAMETLRAKSDLWGTSAEKIVERSEDYKNNELYRLWAKGEHDFSSDREKKFRKKLLPYATLLILTVVAILSFLFFDTNREFLNSFFKKSSEKKELVQIGKIVEPIFAEEKEAKKVVPPVTLDELNKTIPPPASTDKKKDVQERPLSVKKPRALKKKNYSVHIGAFLIEENAVSLVNTFKQKGYNPYVRKVLRNDKKTMHRVLIGKFDNKNKALEQSDIINQKEGFNSFVYQYSL